MAAKQAPTNHPKNAPTGKGSAPKPPNTLPNSNHNPTTGKS